MTTDQRMGQAEPECVCGRCHACEKADLLHRAKKAEWEFAGLQYVVGLYQRWILSHAKYVNSCDHACAECVPGGPIVSKTFVCAVHTARARYAAELAAPEAES